jgi:hypothetical protein
VPDFPLINRSFNLSRGEHPQGLASAMWKMLHQIHRIGIATGTQYAPGDPWVREIPIP